jgi:hypothetical protein
MALGSPTVEEASMTIELSPDDLGALRESLALYLAEFRREVAGTESPELRRQLQRKQNALERILSRLGGEAAA